MNIQTKASFKKEFLSFFRTRVFLIIACVIIGLSIFSPLLMVGMGSLMESMSDLYEEMGTDISGMTEMLGASASVGVAFSVESVTGTGIIVLLLMINKAAGGEQKKTRNNHPEKCGTAQFCLYFSEVYCLSFVSFCSCCYCYSCFTATFCDVV